MSKFAPKAQLTAIVDEWSPYYIQKTKGVIDGSWTSGDTWSGIKDGMVVLAPYGEDVPADVREAADKVKASIVDGSWHPFQGPIKNQAGEEVVAEGAVMSDEDLLKMDWYVEGVQGSLPK